MLRVDFRRQLKGRLCKISIPYVFPRDKESRYLLWEEERGLGIYYIVKSFASLQHVVDSIDDSEVVVVNHHVWLR